MTHVSPAHTGKGKMFWYKISDYSVNTVNSIKRGPVCPSAHREQDPPAMLSFLLLFGLLYGFIDRTALEMTGSRVRVRGSTEPQARDSN